MREAPIIFLELESISYYFFLIAVFFMADASGSNGTGSYSPRRKIDSREWIVLRMFLLFNEFEFPESVHYVGLPLHLSLSPSPKANPRYDFRDHLG